MKSHVTPATACGWLEEQIGELGQFRNASPRDPQFKQWRQNALTCIQRIWPGVTSKSRRFRRVPFSPPSTLADVRQSREAFERGCAEAAQLLRSWVTEIEQIGIVLEESEALSPASELPMDGSPTLTLDGTSDDGSSWVAPAAGVRTIDLPGGDAATPASATPGSHATPPAPAPAPAEKARGVQKKSKNAKPAKPVKKPIRPRLKDMLGLGNLTAPVEDPGVPVVDSSGLEAAPSSPPQQGGDDSFRVERGVEPDELHVSQRPSASYAADESPVPAAPPAPPVNLPDAPELEVEVIMPSGRQTPEWSNPLATIGAEIDAAGRTPSFDVIGSEYETEHRLPPVEAPAAAADRENRTNPVAEFAAEFSKYQGEADELLDREADLAAKSAGRDDPEQDFAPAETSPHERDAMVDVTAASEIAGIATEIDTLDVPAAHRERIYRMLLELSLTIESGEVTWDHLNAVVAAVMPFPALGRRVLPSLMPYIERAA